MKGALFGASNRLALRFESNLYAAVILSLVKNRTAAGATAWPLIRPESEIYLQASDCDRAMRRSFVDALAILPNLIAHACKRNANAGKLLWHNPRLHNVVETNKPGRAQKRLAPAPIAWSARGRDCFVNKNVPSLANFHHEPKTLRNWPEKVPFLRLFFSARWAVFPVQSWRA